MNALGQGQNADLQPGFRVIPFISRHVPLRIAKFDPTIHPPIKLIRRGALGSFRCHWWPLLNVIAARFTFRPILRLSAVKSHTSQTPILVLAREESRLC